MLRRVYLDNSATTAVDPEVVEAMLPFLTDKFGNASSIHFFGQEARAAVDRARHQVAGLINARPNEIVFTSGGTEGNNLAIRGLLEANAKYGNHIVTSQIEHSAVKNVCQNLEKRGFEVTWLPVYAGGVVKIEDVRAAIRDNTVIISVMTANNEIGTLQPVEDIGRLVKELRGQGKKIWFHTDAVQAAGKVPLDVESIGCDLLTLSGHKIYAPKGIGSLFVRRGVRIHPQNIGGRQERERRGGTEPVPGIVAFGKACEMALDALGSEPARSRMLRDRLEHGILEMIPDAQLNGDPDNRLPNISNISFGSVEGEGLLISLDMQGIAVSTGSACSSGSLEPSPVIRALGREDEMARGAIRFSLGRFNNSEEIDHVLNLLPRSVDNLRQMSPNYRTSTAK